ncbi:hypothetical protein PF005_g6194 [Phytophthora fragariae]|uniref:Uncharacterized protein n=1 Tax=Phytophthora fragariae TaxID=53985 RepID=A0A6A3JL36_9STRA|nr:hypothetical protein PF009_g6862 [Phytophthora fragariae]KAE8993135.1 hypothetical protein PF011_g17256 [Phytophthora fragariae]KAE9125152.1 hypothetical protein PF007_g6451 [Phytophthora fragariae]KAE9223721.1 hypothetical protein PF005_g6194 [Phytophthora fragariae]
MDVPVPPDVMTTLSADNVGASVQILSTYVRTCASRLQRTPGMLGDDTFTTAQSGNFSSSDATYFETLDELSFAEEGNYTVAAVAVLGNADNSTLLYYFQTFVDVIVKEVQVEAVEYDSDATYCRVTVQNPLEDALDSNELLVSSTSSEIEIAVQVARVVQAQQPVDIAWTATLTRNSSKDIQLPSPLEAAFVLDEDESGYYTIVSSVVKLCERSKACTEYSSVVDVSSADFSGNFTSASTAAFSSSGIVLPSPGWYSGFAQLTLAGDDADSHRYDFIKYFEVFATEENVAEQVESATVAYAGNGTNCPYTVNMTVSTTTFTVDAGALVSWTVAKQTAFTGADGVAVNMTTVYDEPTGKYVNLPQINIWDRHVHGASCAAVGGQRHHERRGAVDLPAAGLAHGRRGAGQQQRHCHHEEAHGERRAVAKIRSGSGSAFLVREGSTDHSVVHTGRQAADQVEGGHCLRSSPAASNKPRALQRPATMVTYKMDRTTTYCYYMSEKYSQEQPVQDDVLVQDSGSACPITIRVDIADELEKNALIPLRYTATLDTTSADTNFEFPDPIVRVPVPDYLKGNTNASADSSGSTNETTFDVAVANVVMCDWRSCNLFTTAAESATYYSSSNNPNDFSDNVAVFGSQEIVIPKDGKYTGYVHLVVNIAGNSRADFVTFFPVQIGDVAGTSPSSITSDGTTTYCWTSKDVSVFDPSVSGDLTIRTGAYCPGTMSMSLSSTDVYVGDTIDIAWMLDMSDSTTDDSTLIAEVSTTDAILDPRTNIYSVVPVSVFSGCQRNLAGANCSTYTGEDSSTFSIAEYDDMNLTSDAVSYSTNYTFDTSGQFTMFGRVAMVTVDGERIDMAIYSTVTVSVQGGSSGSNLFLYIGIAIGAVILLAGMFFCYMKKRRNNVSTKDIPFRQPVSGLERSSDYTMASSNFLSHKTPAQLPGLDMGGDYNTGNAAPSYLAVDAADSGLFDRTIRAEPGEVPASLESSESLSLNPFERASFAGLSDDATSSRPSEMTKFSFQSGYSDDSEWDYDAQQLRGGSDFSDFSSDPGTSVPTSSTYEMGRGMPILEEDDLADNSFSNDHHPSNSTNDPRSTTSSGWTVQ